MGTSLNNIQPQVVTRLQPQAPASATGVKAAPALHMPAPLAAVKQHPTTNLQAFSEAWKSAKSDGTLAQWAGAAWASEPSAGPNTLAQLAQQQFNATLRSAGQNFATYKTLSEVGANLEASVANGIDDGVRVFQGMTQAHAAYAKAMAPHGGSVQDQWASAQLLINAQDTLRQAQKFLRQGAIFGAQDVRNLNVIMNQLRMVCGNTAQQLEQQVRAGARPEVQTLFATRDVVLKEMGHLLKVAGDAQKLGNKSVAEQSALAFEGLKGRHLELTQKLAALINTPPSPEPPPRPRRGFFSSLKAKLGRMFRGSEQVRQAAAGAPLQVPGGPVERSSSALAAQVKGTLVAAGAPAGAKLPGTAELEQRMVEAHAHAHARAQSGALRPNAGSRQALILDDRLAGQLDQMVKLGGPSEHQNPLQQAAAIKQELGKLNFKIPDIQLEGLEDELAELDDQIMNEPVHGRFGVPRYVAVPSRAPTVSTAAPLAELSGAQLLAELNALQAEDLDQEQAVNAEYDALVKESDEADLAQSNEFQNALRAMEEKEAAQAKLLDDLLRREGLNPNDG